MLRELVWRLLKWFLFGFDAETAHHFTLRAIRAGQKINGGLPLRVLSGTAREAEPEFPKVFGMDFRSRVGLAAGFDKNAEVLTALPSLGFGFAEVGTVTPRPQPGNERPRLFRDPARRALFNRMGFNNLGAPIVAERIARARPALPPGFRVGVNLGKNKDTPLEEASRDHVEAASPFRGLVDYVVLNLSSPNTPGLRSLQTAAAVSGLVGELRDVLETWAPRPPLLLKLAPELSEEIFAEILREASSAGADGFVLTNTLEGSWDGAGVAGGWSGGPLTEISRDKLRLARKLTALPLVSVGGIMDTDEARERIRSGAALIQVYTGWVYGGPAFVPRLAEALKRESPGREAQGFRNNQN